MSRTVLLLTHSGDFATIDWIRAGLQRRGHRALRLDSDTFPSTTRLTVRRGGAGLRIETPEGTVDSDEITAIWSRKIFGPKPAEGLDPAYGQVVQAEIRAHLMGALATLDDRRWVNHPDRDVAAENKPRQLQIAESVGLRVPATLLTNDAHEARAFYEAQGGRVITKLLTPFSMSMSGHSPFVYTTRLSAEDAAAIDGLDLCPMLLQAEVPKETELRVAVVNGRCFVGGIRGAVSAEGPVDWRHPSLSASAQWEHETLPTEVADQVVALTRRLGLVYGAVDLIRRPDGEHVFLEINPAGEWGMLQHVLGLPISEAFVDALLES